MKAFILKLYKHPITIAIKAAAMYFAQDTAIKYTKATLTVLNRRLSNKKPNK